jgi:protein-disulfide isomerase
MKKELLSNVVAGVLVLCALLVTGLVVRRELFPRAALAVRDGGEPVPGWEEYARGGKAMGPLHAPLTLVEFSDFQCPACRVLSTSLKEIREKHPDDVRVVYRHFPLKSHGAAVPAALASECAAAQGRFEPFHDALFSKQDSVGILPWTRFAQEAGVPDAAAFERCVAGSTTAAAALNADTMAGHKLQVRGTPTLLVNGKRYNGAPPTHALEQIVREELRSARKALANR